MSSKLTIYVLSLQQGKYYIGKTTKELQFRIDSHFQNTGSAYTQIYKPLSIIEIFENCDHFDEDKITKQYMAKFGINNVRGGSYCQVNLTEQQLNLLKKEIRMSNDLCLRCGRNSHFVNQCFATYDFEGNLISQPQQNKVVDTSCSRCGRSDHTADKCYANYNIKKCKINSGSEPMCSILEKCCIIL